MNSETVSSERLQNTHSGSSNPELAGWLLQVIWLWAANHFPPWARSPLAGFTARAHRWLSLSFLSTEISGPLPQNSSPDRILAGCADLWTPGSEAVCGHMQNISSMCVIKLVVFTTLLNCRWCMSIFVFSSVAVHMGKLELSHEYFFHVIKKTFSYIQIINFFFITKSSFITLSSIVSH